MWHSKNITVFFSTALFLSFIAYFVLSLANYLDQESVEDYIARAIEHYLVDVHADYDNISIRIGTSAEVRISELQVGSSRYDDEVFFAQDIRLRIPYYLIIGGDGRLNIDVSGLRLNYDRFYEHLNKAAFDDVTPAEEFFDRSRTGLRVFDLDLKLDDDGHILSFDKFILKNLSTNFKTAFEIDSEVSVSFPPDKNLRLHMLAVGEFSLKKLIQKARLESNYFIRLNHISTLNNLGESVSTGRVREIQGRGSLVGVGLSNFSGDISFRGDDGEVSADFDLSENTLKLEGIRSKVRLMLVDSLGLASVESNVFRGVSLLIDGDVEVFSDLSISPTLNFELDGDVDYDIANVSLSNSVQGSIEGDVISAQLSSRLLGGEISYVAKGGHAFRLNDLTLARLEDIEIDIIIRDINVRHAILREQTLFNAFENFLERAGKQDVPLRKAFLNITNLALDGSMIEGSGEYRDDGEGTSLKLSLAYDEGSARVFIAREGSYFNSTLKLEDFDLAGGKIFLPIEMWKYGGVYSATVQLNWMDGDLVDSLIGHVDLEGSNGSLPAEFWEKLLSGNLDRFMGSGNYSKLSGLLSEYQQVVVNLQVEQGALNIKKLEYSDRTESLSLIGSGQLGIREDASSEITLEFIDDNGVFFQGGSDGSEGFRLPLRLRGSGVNLSPDLMYTIQNMNN